MKPQPLRPFGPHLDYREPPEDEGKREVLGPLALKAIWYAVVVSTLTLFVLAIPWRQAELTEALRNLSPAQELVLRELIGSVDGHARLVLAIEIGVPAIFVVVGLLIRWRRPDDWVATLVSLTLVTYICWTSPPLDSLVASDTIWRLPATLLQAVGMVGALSFLYIFPDGRFIPRWTGFVHVLWVAWGVSWLAFPASQFNIANPFRTSLLPFALLILGWTGGIGVQAYRFLRASGPLQRQQTKLVVSAAAVGILGYLVFGFDRFALPLLAEPRHANVVYDLIGVPIFLLISTVIPVAFAASILRYRLWDIDLFFNRALVYGLLTAVLAGMYTASITLSQRVFVALTGERSDAAIVLTTLVVASTFTSLKGRLQAVVDRHLRRPPDPVEDVKGFAKQVRQLVETIDVERLLSKTLEETVRAFAATGGAVYLLEDGQFRPVQTNGEWSQVEGMVAWLEYEKVRFGWLVLGPRRQGPAYTPTEQQVLTDIGALVGQALYLLEGATFVRHHGPLINPTARAGAGEQ